MTHVVSSEVDETLVKIAVAPANGPGILAPRAKQIDMLFNQQPSALVANIVAGTSLFVILLVIGVGPLLYVWYGTLMLVTAFRINVIRLYRKKSLQEPGRTDWLKLLTFGGITAGITWGFSWLALYPGEPILAEGIVVLWISGMCAGATSTLSLIKSAYFSFTIPAVLPITLHLFYSGGTMQAVLAYALIMYYGFSMLIALRNHKDLNHALGLQLLNDDLLSRLNIEKRNLEEKNEELLTQRRREMELQDELLRKERLATLGQLAGTVSHELRNPLGTLRTTFSIIKLKIEEKNYTIDNELKRIDRNIERCDGIIGDILDYAKATPPELNSTEFDSWLELVLDEISVPPHIRIDRHLNSHVTIAIDRDRISRAIFNIIDNALQAIEQERKPGDNNKEYSLSIETETREGKLITKIRDNGPGMTQEDAENVFEPLFSTKMFGVGLGLPIVEQIIREHEGDIQFTTEKGLGTEFLIFLPISNQEI